MLEVLIPFILFLLFTLNNDELQRISLTCRGAVVFLSYAILVSFVSVAMLAIFGIFYGFLGIPVSLELRTFIIAFLSCVMAEILYVIARRIRVRV